MELNLTERDRKILESVIRDYIYTAEPVGSRTLSRRYDLSISPATIRNVMADLEGIGLLTQPYTSAGRVPTEKGLRYYVDSILEVKGISDKEQAIIEKEFTGATPEGETIARLASKVLSSLSKHLGVVVAPKFSRITLKQLQFIRVGRRHILAILVGISGMIQNRLLEVKTDIDQESLDRFNRYLNETFEGLTISEIKRKIVEEMREEKYRFDTMLSRALDLSRKFFDDETVEDHVFIDGHINLMDYPEFSAVDTLKTIFKTFEDKSILVKLLDNTLNASGVQIFIGTENELSEMSDCTLIASRYSRGSRVLGTLGVIGPMRLNYSRIIPVVDYTAKLVSHILESTL
jgi:heat-inducible transcriptional repressor